MPRIHAQSLKGLQNGHDHRRVPDVPRVRPLLASVVIGVASLCATLPAQAQLSTNSALYYRLGGGSPTAGANNRGQVALNLGISARLNYSCGKFDIGAALSQLMNQVKNLGATFSNALRSGISALPLYVLERAQPGLYHLFQSYSQKAELLVAAALKSCEEMEAQIKAGQDPYEDWVRLAKGEAWKVEASNGSDIMETKQRINADETAQKAGVDWPLGGKAGGVGQRPIQPVRDLSIAGYNATLNRAPSTSPTVNNSGTDSGSRMVRAFPTAESLAGFNAEVLGDKSFYICSRNDCPQPTTTNTATGLAPKFEAELANVMPKLRTLTDPSQSNYNNITDVSAPGMAISTQLVDALRKMPTDSRSVAVNRLSQELAVYKIIDKALIARNALLTGLNVPEATKNGEMQKELQTKVDRMTQYINDLMFEFRIRKEMTAQTALTILEGSAFQDAQGLRTPGGSAAETRPLVDGRVKATN